MLKQLNLHDFQAHEALQVTFSPSITSIVGPTDAGKSAILRALRWLCLNDLSGDAFIRDGAKQTRVTLQIEEHTIMRAKGRHNTYELDGQEHEAVGRDVPANIAALLKMSELNFQNQHDAPFWFAESASEVSRQLNAVVDLSIIDTTLSNVAAEVRRANERRSLAQERLTSAQAEWNHMESQADRIEEFTQLKELYDQYQQIEKNHCNLEDLVSAARAHRQSWATSAERAEDQSMVAAAAREARQFAERFRVLVELIAEIQEQERCVAPPDFAPVEAVHLRLKETEEKKNQLYQLINQIGEEGHIADILAQEVIVTENQFQKQTKGKQCPLCKQIIRI